MVRTLEKAKVTLPSDTEVRLTRDFAAPRQLVWDAHTRPQLVRRWMPWPARLVDARVRDGCPSRRQVSLAMAV